MRWVAEYERGWRADDLSAVERLFTPSARYRRSPYGEPLQGHEALREFWLEDQGQAFTMQAITVALEDGTAVVRVEVRYAGPTHQEYRDLWLLTFSDDGRVDDFEEWAYWPDKPYAAI